MSSPQIATLDQRPEWTEPSRPRNAPLGNEKIETLPRVVLKISLGTIRPSNHAAREHLDTRDACWYAPESQSLGLRRRNRQAISLFATLRRTLQFSFRLAYRNTDPNGGNSGLIAASCQSRKWVDERHRASATRMCRQRSPLSKRSGLINRPANRQWQTRSARLVLLSQTLETLCSGLSRNSRQV
jgi:hypothetical protein